MRAVLDADPRDLPWQIERPQGERLTRLDTAKIVVQDFISRRRTDRIGVVVFGKSPYVLSPPTLDYQLLTQLVAKMSLQVIDGSATAIGDALGTAVARLRRSDALSKVIVLITDGDSNAGRSRRSTPPSSRPASAPSATRSRSAPATRSRCRTAWISSATRATSRHRFPVNPELLEHIAKTTGGEAYVATDGKALAESMHSVLDQLEKTRFEASIASYEDLFPLLLIPGVFLVGARRAPARVAAPEVPVSALSGTARRHGASTFRPRAARTREVAVHFAAPYYLLGTAVALVVAVLLVLGGIRAARAVAPFGDEELRAGGS